MDTINDIEQTEFYNKYKGLSSFIVSNILRDIGTTEDVKECVNDVLLEIMKKYDNYNEDRGSIENYICILSRSRAINFRKRLQKNITIPFTDDILLKNSNGDYIKDIIEKVILELSYGEKQLFKYKFVYEYPNAEIAKALKLTLGYTKIKIYRLKKKLMKLFKKHGIESWEV